MFVASQESTNNLSENKPNLKFQSSDYSKFMSFDGGFCQGAAQTTTKWDNRVVAL